MSARDLIDNSSAKKGQREQTRALREQAQASDQASKLNLANTAGQFDLARQKLAGATDVQTTAMRNQGAMQVTGAQGANDLARQKLVGENNIATTGMTVQGHKDVTGMQVQGQRNVATLQNTGAMDRQRLAGEQDIQKGREAIAGNIIVGGGTGTAAQNLINARPDATPDVADVGMPGKVQTGLYGATKDEVGNPVIYSTATGRIAGIEGQPEAQAGAVKGTVSAQGRTAPVPAPVATPNAPTSAAANLARPGLSSFDKGGTQKTGTSTVDTGTISSHRIKPQAAWNLNAQSAPISPDAARLVPLTSHHQAMSEAMNPAPEVPPLGVVGTQRKKKKTPYIAAGAL